MAELKLAHEQIKQQLLQRIGRVWTPGTRVPSSPDLARQLGVGQRNTHRALAELADEGYLVARRGMGTFVSPNLHEIVATSTARGPLAGRCVGVLVRRKFPMLFEQRVLDALDELLLDAGAEVSHQVAYWDRLADYADFYRGCDALVMLNPDKHGPIVLPADVPTVVITTSNELRIGAAGGYDVVAADDYQGAYLAGQTMRRVGCERPGFIGCSRNAYDEVSAARLAAFEAGYGHAVDQTRRFHGKSYMPSSGGRAVAAYLQLDPRPDGVFAASDELACGFAIGASAVGLEAGRDYKLIGFDGQETSTGGDFSHMTTVAVPFAEMGRRAADLLTKRVTQPDRPAQRVTLSCELYAGETCPPKEES